LADPAWSAWTIWNTAALLVSALTFAFYIYITIAIIIASVDGLGKYNSNTALLNEPYNMWIFFALNSIYLINSIVKFWIVMLTLENFVIMDDDILYWWNELKFYMWDPDQRLELEIEGYAELAKTVVVVANYFIYW